VLPADVRSAVLTGLRNGVRYRVLVAASSAAGHGPTGKSLAVRPGAVAPPAPSGVTAAPAGSGIRVSWQPPVSTGGSPLTGYVVTVTGTTRKLSVPASAHSLLVTGLRNGQKYTFAVRAKNGKGVGPAAASPPATAGATVAAATVVLSGAALAALSQVRTDGSLVFTKPPAQVSNLRAGNVVVAGVSRATPGGLLDQVTSVSSAAGAVTVDTKPAALDQALSAAGFGIRAALGRGQLASFKPARRGIALAPAAHVPGCATPNISLTVQTTLYKSANGRSVTVKGSVCVAPTVSFAASITCCFHTASSFTGTVTAAASLSLTAQLSKEISGGLTLGFLTFDPIVFDVAGVPIVIIPTLSVKLVARGSVSVGVTVGAGESTTLGGHVTTKDGHAAASPIYAATTAFSPPTLSGSVSAAVGVQGNLSTKIDGLPGPTLTDTLWIFELTVDPAANPWWTLDLENVLDVHYKLRLLDHTLAQFMLTLSDVKVKLAAARSPYQQVKITPRPAVVARRHSLQLHAKVTGVLEQRVTWKTAGGSISPSGLYTAPAKAGTYLVTATSQASGLYPGATGQTSVQVGAQPPSPPQNPAATSTKVGAATVSWHLPADTGGANISEYKIVAHPGSQSISAPGISTRATLIGLTPGASYTFTVTATNAGGTSLPSPATSPVTIDDVKHGGGGGGGGGSWTATKAPLPPDARANPSSDLESVACPSVTFCVAAGHYSGTGFDDGLLEARSGSTWTVTKAPLPAHTSANPDVTLDSTACAEAGSCTAVGNYTDSSGNAEALIETLSAGTWTATEAPQPSASSDQGASLSSIECPSPSSCVAVGGYHTSLTIVTGMIETESGGNWTVITAPLPAGGAAGDLSSVVCPSASSCIAVGEYDQSSMGNVPLIETWSGTTWTPTAVPLPAGAAANPETGIASLACESASSCAATGSYVDSSGNSDALLLTLSGSTWTSQKAPLPADSSANTEAFPMAVACSASTCAVTGEYVDSAGHLQGLIDMLSGTTWKAIEAPLPADANSNPRAGLSAVTCAATANCVAVGTYQATPSTDISLLDALSASTWANAKVPLTPDGTEASDLLAVTCPAASSCLAVGGYWDTSGGHQSLLLSGSG